jgi:hypothetical protein
LTASSAGRNRASLPGAAELFRSTSNTDRRQPIPRRPPDGERRGTGREKHNSKITVYVSDEELLALEHARLRLRGEQGLVADRGRVVREAIAVLIADYEAHGADSLLVQRLRGDTEQ